MRKYIISLCLLLLLASCPVTAYGAQSGLKKPGLKKPPAISGVGEEDKSPADEASEAPDAGAKEEIPGPPGNKKPEIELPERPAQDNKEDTDNKDHKEIPKEEPAEEEEEAPEEAPEESHEETPGEDPDVEIREEPAKEPAKEPVEETVSESVIQAEPIETTVDVAAENPEKWWENDRYLILFGASGIIILLLLLIIVRLVRKQKTQTGIGLDHRTDPPKQELIKREAIRDPKAGDVELDIKMMEGSLKKGNGTFYMRKDILIGSDPDQCEIAIEGNGVAIRHARIYITDGHLFIEDLDTEGGTYVGGMRIYSANRIRNDDEIGIGDTGFAIRFSGRT